MAESGGSWTPPSRSNKYRQLARPISRRRFVDQSDELAEHLYPLLRQSIKSAEGSQGIIGGKTELIADAPVQHPSPHAPEEHRLLVRRLEFRTEGFERFASLMVGKLALKEQADDTETRRDISQNLALAAETPGLFIDGFIAVALQCEQMLRAMRTANSRQTSIEAQGIAEGLETGLLLFDQLDIVQDCRNAAKAPPSQPGS